MILPDCVTKTHRARLRSLPALLLSKFLNEYGYDKGPVVARAILEDILVTIEGCHGQRVGPRQCLWLAVRVDRVRRRAIQATDLVPVRLTLITEEEIAMLDDPELSSHRQATGRCRQHRVIRMYFEAYEQGGVLTVLDLSLILGVSQKVICEHIRTYERETGQLVPTRDTVPDVGSGVTHKGEVVRRFLRGESPDQIARNVHHSQAAVDRYLAAYQRIRLLAQKFPEDQLPALSGIALSVVAEYLALMREYEPELELYPSGPGSDGDDTVVPPVVEPARASNRPPHEGDAG